MVGIYKITNLLNNKCYIGQSVHIEIRFREHCRPSSKSLIHSAIVKYGKDNFSFEVLEECKIEDLNKLESYYINKFNSVVPNGYNVEEFSETEHTTFTLYDKDCLKRIFSDIKDTNYSFKEISEKYNLSCRTITRLNNGKSHFNPEYSYPIRNLEDKIKKSNSDSDLIVGPNNRICLKPHQCPVCNKLTTNKIYCSFECSHIGERITERPSRKELKKLIRTKTFVQIGRDFSVSDNAIKKWCKNYNLPSKASEIKKISDENWELL